MTEAIYKRAERLKANLLFRLYCYAQPRFWKARKAFKDAHHPDADYMAMIELAWALTGHRLSDRGVGTATQTAMRWLARDRN